MRREQIWLIVKCLLSSAPCLFFFQPAAIPAPAWSLAAQDLHHGLAIKTKEYSAELAFSI